MLQAPCINGGTSGNYSGGTRAFLAAGGNCLLERNETPHRTE